MIERLRWWLVDRLVGDDALIQGVYFEDVTVAMEKPCRMRRCVVVTKMEDQPESPWLADADLRVAVKPRVPLAPMPNPWAAS